MASTHTLSVSPPSRIVAAVIAITMASATASAWSVALAASGTLTGPGRNFWRYTVAAGAMETVSDFHICVGQDSTTSLSVFQTDAIVTDMPTGWSSSVSRVGSNIYINFHTASVPDMLMNGEISSDFEVQVLQASTVFRNTLVGSPAYIATQDGGVFRDDDPTTGQIPNTPANPNPRFGPPGPILLSNDSFVAVPVMGKWGAVALGVLLLGAGAVILGRRGALAA